MRFIWMRGEKLGREAEEVERRRRGVGHAEEAAVERADYRGKKS